jgi:hypothetical protein
MSKYKIEVYGHDGTYLRDVSEGWAKWPPGEGDISHRTDEDEYCLVVQGDVTVARFTLIRRTDG